MVRLRGIVLAKDELLPSDLDPTTPITRTP